MKISSATYCNHTSTHLIFLRNIRQLFLSYTKCIKSRVSSGLSLNNSKPKLQFTIFIFICLYFEYSRCVVNFLTMCFHIEEVENLRYTLRSVFYLFSFLPKYVTCKPILEHVPIKPFYFDFWEIRISTIWVGNSKPGNTYLFVGGRITYHQPPKKLIQQNFCLYQQRSGLNRFDRRLTVVFAGQAYRKSQATNDYLLKLCFFITLIPI